MDNNVYNLIDVPTASDRSQTVSGQFSKIISSICAGPACAIIVMGVHSIIFQLIGTFSDMLHPRYIITVHISQLVENFNGEACLDHENQAIQQMSSQDEVFSVVAIPNKLVV
jgi:hypothetical protein